MYSSDFKCAKEEKVVLQKRANFFLAVLCIEIDTYDIAFQCCKFHVFLNALIAAYFAGNTTMAL